jgi:2,3,4,5-tetrahydropyridine-2-carboxylate N-succinyltransferase
MNLEVRINALFDSGLHERTPAKLELLSEFRAALNRGWIRVAEPREDHWVVHPWVKKGIALHLALGLLQPTSSNGLGSCFELDTLPPRTFSADDAVRIPPGGSSIRDGCYLGPGVACMPPVFVNLGAWIGAEAMLDSHVMVGICAQIGRRARISSGTQIGGFLHPLDRLPTIISDDAVIGGNCGVYDGVVVGAGAILAAGTVVTAQSRIYDPIRRQEYRAAADSPLVIPPLAIVVPGARTTLRDPALMVQVPIIAGYRDDPALSEDLLQGLLG